jgi:hypothetical protein
MAILQTNQIVIMKSLLTVLLSITFFCSSAQEKPAPQVIIETTFAQVVNQPSSGYNFGVYYKTKWPIAARFGVTHVFTGNDFYRFRTGYLQIGYMQNAGKWLYHTLIGGTSGEARLFLPVYSGGLGYTIRERRGKIIRAVLQMNYAKNRLQEKLWAHIGFHFAFPAKEERLKKD